MTSRPIDQGPRYLAVSLFCAALHNSIMVVLDSVDVVYGISLLISMAVLIPTGFLLQATFTFAAERNWPAFRRYTTVMIANLPITFAVIWMLYDLIGLRMLVAAPLSTLLLLTWNFLASDWALKAPRDGAAKMGPAA